MVNKRTLFGALSLWCAILAVLCAIIFISSGYFLSSMLDEQGMVIVQLTCVFILLLSALLGLGLGITGIFKDVPTALAKAGTGVNVVLWIFIIIAFLPLMIAFSNIS